MGVRSNAQPSWRRTPFGSFLLIALVTWAPLASADEATPPAEGGKRARVAGMVTAAAVSLGAAVAGAGILAGSWSEYQGLEAQCAGRCPYPVVTPLEQRVTAGFALTAIGGVALLLDGIALGLELRRPPPARSVVVLPAGPGLVVSGTFP